MARFAICIGEPRWLMGPAVVCHVVARCAMAIIHHAEIPMRLEKP